VTPERVEAGETEPHALAAQAEPDRDKDQVTPLLCVSFCRLAVKVWVAAPVATLAVVGDTLTVILAAVVTVMDAAADLVESAIVVAVRVMGPAGAVAGAV
jgi:hypothetical protein